MRGQRLYRSLRVGAVRRGLATSCKHPPSFSSRKHAPDDPPRLTCDTCGFINYENPLLVVGSVPTIFDPATQEEKVLLCRRAITPRKGFWNLCAGYMEKGEGVRDAACREALEEANARIRVDHLLSMYDIKHIGQVHIYFSSTLLSPEVSPGVESSEVQLFRWQDVPWSELAFPTVSWALMHHLEQRKRFPVTTPVASSSSAIPRADFAPFTNPVIPPPHATSVNVWYNPSEGLVYDDTWTKSEGVTKDPAD